MSGRNGLVALVQHLRQRYGSAAADGDLLARFARERDEEAFAELVRRHGGLVLNVARRQLGDRHRAEDVFQTTFLALARQARRLRPTPSLVNWLYTVALRQARKVRDAAVRRECVHRQPTPHAPPPDPLAEVSGRELVAVIDEELSRLPEAHRLPLLLCAVEGLSREEAARRLGWTTGMVKGRLERGRELLRQRLTGRGLTVPAVLASVLAADATASVPHEWIAATSRAALAALTAPAAVSFKALAAAGVVLAALGVGAGVTALPGGHTDPPPVADQPVPQPAEPAPRVERLGDLLPDGALARLGSVRLRHVGVSEYMHFPDSKTAVTVGSDRVVRTWDLTTGREIRAVPLQGDGPHGNWTAFSPDGKTLVASVRKDLTFWETASGREFKRLAVPDEDTSSLCFSPDGNTLAVGNWSMRVSLVEWRTGRQRVLELPKRPGGRGSGFHAHFSPDGKWFVAGWGEALCVFETRAWQEIHRLMCNSTISVVTPDSKTLAALCSRQGDVTTSDLRLFDLATGRERVNYPLPGWHFSLAVSPDGKTIACGRSDNCCLLDLATGRVLHRLTGRPLEVMFAPDGKVLVARSDTANGLRLWDAVTGAERLERPTELGQPLAGAVSPDGRLLAAAAWVDRAVTLWNLADGQPVRALPLGAERYGVRDLSFSADGQTLSAAQYKGLVQFWDPANGHERQTLQLHDLAHPDPPSVYYYRLQVSADGRRVTTLERLLTQPQSTRLAVWDAATGRPTDRQSLPAEQTAWVWTRDESAVVMPVSDGLAVFDGGRLRTRYRIADGSPRRPVAVAPSGRLLAARKTADGSDAVGVWDLDTGQAVTALATGRVDHLALAVDDRTCVTAGAGALRVWDLATGRERGRRPLPAATTALLLTPDGRRAITTLADGTGLVWDLTAFPVEPLARSAGATEVAAWWTDLAGDDAAKAHAAAWRLADAPAGVVVPVLAKYLRPAALAVRPSGPVASADALRQLRAVEALEHIGTADARQVLQRLADGAPDARLTREAQASLERLKRRKP